MSTHKEIIKQITLTSLCISLVIPFNLVLDAKNSLGEFVSYKTFFSYKTYLF